MKICIVGAGPAGSFTAYNLAKQGYEVELYEEHPKVGVPIQCTGILTKEAEQLLPMEGQPFLVNTIRKIKVHSKNKETIVPVKEYIVCRTRFDQYIANMAQEAGAKLFLSHRFIAVDDNEILFRDLENNDLKIAKADILIGADGPNSAVAKAANLFGKREFYYGVQATVKRDYNGEMYETWLGSYCPDMFVWSVPEDNEKARVGLASSSECRKKFDEFMKIHGGEILDWQGGLIPKYESIKVEGKIGDIKVYLVGDAALQVKKTTAGGIIQGMKAGKILADVIKNGGNYKRKLLPLRRELWLHKMIRKCLDNMSDDDFDKLIDIINREKTKKILEKYPRDKPIPLMANLLFYNPSLLRFAAKII